MRNYVKLTIAEFTHTSSHIMFFVDDPSEADYFKALLERSLGSPWDLTSAMTVYFEMNKRNIIDAFNWPNYCPNPCQDNANFINTLNQVATYGWYLFAGSVPAACWSSGLGGAGYNFKKLTDFLTRESPKKSWSHGK